MADHIRYDLLTQQALRGVVRSVLTEVAKNDRLPGDHHFYISFDTHADGVRLSDRLRAQYPDEMTIILQHQFWGLSVNDLSFEVGLSFGGIPEKLTVPFAAITEFVDPSVQFGLRFEDVTESVSQGPAVAVEKPAKKKRPAASVPAMPLASPPPTASPEPVKAPPAAATPAPKPDKPDKPAGGGEVVRLDRFRKK